MEHLSLEIFDLAGSGSKYANLPENTSITITDTSEIFASGDVWSHAFTLNVEANTDIFGTSGDIHGSRLHEQFNGRRARIWVDGLPLYLGYLKLDDEVDVDEDGNVDVTFESGQKTFEKLIEGGKANQVPMMSDVQIGMALYRKRWTCAEVELEATAVFEKLSLTATSVLTHDVHPPVLGDEDSRLTYFVSDGEADSTPVQPYPRMVFPKGTFYNMSTKKDETIDCINTYSPYDDNHPYCNIALCYQKYGYTVATKEADVKYTHEDYSSSPSAERGYEVMPANRVNSAPNFYVIYWLKALAKHLGIYIEENQMMDVEDLRRLFFVNTNCAYREIQYLRDPNKADLTYGKYQFDDKGPLVSEYMGDLVDEKYDKKIKRWNGPKTITKAENCGLDCEAFTQGNEEIFSKVGNIDHIEVKVKSVAGMSSAVRAYYDGYGSNGYGSNGYGNNRTLQRNLLLHKAMASSECFPNVDISEVIDALKSGFGVRLLFDDNYKRVRIVLLRNIFRNKDIQTINCDIIEETKTENCTRGFRMTYGDSDDTTFYYKGFSDMLLHKTELWIDNSDTHDYSKWQLNTEYANLLNKISAFDVTCYVTPNNGNAYGIKVDKDAKRYDELYPSLFEYAGYMDAEDGDCTGDNETIETVNVSFAPAIMNDVNFENERKDRNIREQRFALFVDESMRPRRPDLKDLPDETNQPGVKSYDDANAVYNIDKLYAKHGPNGSDTKMVNDGVVQPGSFVIASDMYVEYTFDSLKFSQVRFNNVFSFTNSSFTLKNVKIKGHINEGYRLYLQDNFEPNDDGICPIETHDWGLTLGIMRGNGSDSYVKYSTDPNDGEGNDTWDVVPGSTSTAHPDTCDSYGNLWDYNGSLHVSSAADAKKEIESRYPDTASVILEARYDITVQKLKDAGWEVSGNLTRKAKYYYYKLTVNSKSMGYVNIYATPIAAASTVAAMGKPVYTQAELKEYILNIWNQYKTDITKHDTLHLIYAVNPSNWSTLAYLRAIYFGYTPSIDLDNGVGDTDGRISLKLRAEKPNPYYKKGSTKDEEKNQYLPITNENLRGRGLCDQFYKEYSYWVRNARIIKLTVHMTLAQFLAIDKTKRVRVGDIIGFIKKMEFTVNNQSGLGNVTMEIMYI